MIKKLLYSLITVFVLIVAFFVFFEETIFPVVALLGFIFFILGITLIIKARKIKDKTLKKYLMITGIAASGCFLGVILHNLFYGFMIHFYGENYWGNSDEAFFFIIGIIVCPIVFIIGAIGSIVILKKNK